MTRAWWTRTLKKKYRYIWSTWTRAQYVNSLTDLAPLKTRRCFQIMQGRFYRVWAIFIRRMLFMVILRLRIYWLIKMRMSSFQTLEHPKLSMLFQLGWRLASLELALNTQREAFTGWLRRFCLVHPMVEGLTFGHSVARFWKLRAANTLGQRKTVLTI